MQDRRTAFARRRSLWHALLAGSLKSRRRIQRRAGDCDVAGLDWHHPQWLAVAIVLLLLSATDALLTLTLIGRGASELNPLMEPLVLGDGRDFALWKMTLTLTGVVILILLARMRLFGRVPVAAVLYVVLGAYSALVGYELHLLGSQAMGI